MSLNMICTHQALKISFEQTEKKLTYEEAKVFSTLKANCFRGLAFGAVTGSALAWTVPFPWKVRTTHRFVLSVGVGFIGGILGFRRSVDSSLDLILALDGSRIQRELTTIIVNKFPDDIKRIGRISQHFYQERVYDDTTSDMPIYRWRHRNHCVDNNAKIESQDSSDNENNNYAESDNKKADVASKQIPANLVSYDSTTSPFDLIFGGSEDESHYYPPNDDKSGVKARIVARRSKRSQRRKRRLHRHELPQAMNV